jgi:hypothetical protein
VLAGFISSPEKWALFSDEWAAILAAQPNIDYFKMREAHYFKGQFEGWNRGSRDAKISDLGRVIEKYVMAGISLSITIDEYNEIFAPITHKAARSPYFLAVFNMVSMLARYQIDMKYIPQALFWRQREAHSGKAISHDEAALNLGLPTRELRRKRADHVANGKCCLSVRVLHVCCITSCPPRWSSSGRCCFGAEI